MAATQTQADGDFKIDGQDIGQVTLIAAVRNINQASTQNIYMIEDGTGVIDAKKYPSDHDDPEEVNSILCVFVSLSKKNGAELNCCTYFCYMPFGTMQLMQVDGLLTC